MKLRLLACTLVAAGLLRAEAVAAQADQPARTPNPPDSAATAPDPQRFEVAGFPIIAGNTDIGVQFGVAATLTRFSDDLQPYAWNIDLLLSSSLKSTDRGLRFIQQSDVLRLDAPQLFGGKLRLDSRASFERTVDDGYFGVGNFSVAQDALAKHYQYLFNEAHVRSIVRVHTRTRLDVAFALDLRAVYPSAYADSVLSGDLGTAAHGGKPTGLGKLGAGFMYDTRDSEFVTQRGLFYQVGVAGTVGTSAEHLGYGETAAVLSHYLPLSASFVFAARAVGSVEFGRVPFYDLARGGVFEPQRLFGGETGVRGVPRGRYAGPIKALANLEVRGVSGRFMLLGQRLRVGSTTFFDCGRVWDPALAEGIKQHGAGVKWGLGGGAFLQWGDAAIFRIEVAYSPDAKLPGGSLPIGIYAADGLMF